MNEEMLAMLPSKEDYRKEVYEAVWLKAVNAGLTLSDRTISTAMYDADRLLEGFKLRFDPCVGEKQ